MLERLEELRVRRRLQARRRTAVPLASDPEDPSVLVVAQWIEVGVPVPEVDLR